MRISHPISIRLSALILSGWIRLYMRLLDVKVGVLQEDTMPAHAKGRCIYVVWHENMILAAGTQVRYRVASLVSQHRDGELITQIVRMMRGSAIRGSTSRGGTSALLKMMARAGTHHLAITPDGPRGPRRILKLGAIYLASRTGMPLVPAGMAYSDFWRIWSWDKTAVPKPFGRARMIFGRPLFVPPDLSKPELEHYRRLAQDALDEAQLAAERWALKELEMLAVAQDAV